MSSKVKKLARGKIQKAASVGLSIEYRGKSVLSTVPNAFPQRKLECISVCFITRVLVWYENGSVSDKEKVFRAHGEAKLQMLADA